MYPLPFAGQVYQNDDTIEKLKHKRDFTLEVLNDDDFYKECGSEMFMLFYYKTSICPDLFEKHDWSECNYGHRLQDIRRTPFKYFYYAKKCPYIGFDGSWEDCPDGLKCKNSHKSPISKKPGLP